MRLFKRKISKAPTPQVPAWQLQTGFPAFEAANRMQLFTEMQRDPMIQTALTVKKLGVLASKWRLVGDPEKVAFLERAFSRMQGTVSSILFAAMDAFVTGWSLLEPVYELEDGIWWLQGVYPMNPAYFTPELGQYQQPTAVIQNLPGEEKQTLSIERFALYRYRNDYAHPLGQSDLEAVIPNYQTKKRLMAAWQVHLDKFATPTLTGRFNKSASSDDQAAMLRALEGLSRNTAIVFPDDFELGTLGETVHGSQGFLEAISFHNREISRAILGQTLTTDEGSRVGSLALGKVHLQVLLLQLEAIRREIAETLMTEQIIRPLIELNFGEGEFPRFEFEPVELSAFTYGGI